MGPESLLALVIGGLGAGAGAGSRLPGCPAVGLPGRSDALASSTDQLRVDRARAPAVLPGPGLVEVAGVESLVIVDRLLAQLGGHLADDVAALLGAGLPQRLELGVLAIGPDRADDDPGRGRATLVPIPVLLAPRARRRGQHARIEPGHVCGARVGLERGELAELLEDRERIRPADAGADRECARVGVLVLALGDLPVLADGRRREVGVSR